MRFACSSIVIFAATVVAIAGARAARAQDAAAHAPAAPPMGQDVDKLGRARARGYVAQSLGGVLPDMAQRMFLALLKSDKSSLTKNGVSVAFEWRVESSHYRDRSFDLTAHMIGDYRIFDGPTGVLGWVGLGRGDQQLSFRYDKQVLIEYDARTQLLSVTMPEAAEQIGTYNVVVKGKAKSDLSVKPQVSIASKSFGLSLSSSKDEYTAAVTGLPYLLAPQLELDTIGQARYLQLRMGFNWESRGELVATSSAIEEKSGVNLSLSYGGDQVAAELGRSSERQPFQGTISVKGDGAGLSSRLVYTEQVGGWRADLTADQSWQIASSTMPILKVGDVHTTKTEQTNETSPTAPRVAASRPQGDLPKIFTAAATADDRLRAMQSKFGTPTPPIATRPIAPVAGPPTTGLAGSVPSRP